MFLKKLKNNKGMSAIIYVFIMLICIYIFAFIIDMIAINQTKYLAIREAAFVARVAGRQGGFESSKPQYYDNSEPYITGPRMIQILTKAFNTNNINSWEVTVNGRSLYTNTVSDFQNDMNVRLSVSYKWGFLPKVLPMNPIGNFSVKHLVKSERFVRYEEYQE